MDEHPNAAAIRRALEESQGDPASLGDLVAEDVVWHQIGGETITGKAALAGQLAPGARDFEVTIAVHDVVANDEHAVALVNATGRRGNRTLQYRTAEILHLRDGKVTERWAFSDDTAAITEFFR